MTALIWAAANGQEGCVKALLTAGADKDVKTIVSSGAYDDPLMADDPSHGLRLDGRPSSGLPGGVRRDVSGCCWRQGLTGASRTTNGDPRPSTLPTCMDILPSGPSSRVDLQRSFS